MAYQRRREFDPVQTEVDRLVCNGMNEADARALAEDPQWLKRPSIIEEDERSKGRS